MFVKKTHRKNKQSLKFVHLPAKEAEAIPWYRLWVDIIVPYEIITKGHKDPLKIKVLTMIDPTTGLFEIIKYK